MTKRGITGRKKSWTKWNRKIHIYLGLFLLLYIWLIGISGLLLNHQWEFANSWERRVVSSYDATINLSSEREKQILVQEIMENLNLSGSIVNLRYSNDSSNLNFIVTKPGKRIDVVANISDGKTLVKEAKFDQWQTFRFLHKLRNPTVNEMSERHQPTLAFIWSLSLDVLSVGLIVICLGSWYMWLQLTGKRFYIGLVSLIGGLFMCIYFLFF